MLVDAALDIDPPARIEAPPRVMGARLHARGVRNALVWGAQDAVTLLPQGRTLAALIPGASLVVLPSASHIPAIEAPAAFDAALLKWLGPIAPVISPVAK